MARATGIRIQTGTVSLWRLVIIDGDLDLASHATVQAAIHQACEGLPKPRLIVDLTGVEFLDSFGLDTLLRAIHFVEAQHGRVIVVGLQPRVRRVLELTGTLTAMETYDSLDELTRRQPEDPPASE